MRRRNKSCLVRFTEAEYYQVHQIAEEAGVPLQTYLHNAALNIELATNDEIEAYKKLGGVLDDYDKQLRGIATNINQMAHVANINGCVPGTVELNLLVKEVTDIRNELMRQWQSIRRSIKEQSRIRH